VRRRSPEPVLGELTAALYRTLAEVSGAPLLLDSSKHPGEALLAATLAPVELRVVHLVRDPRAVAFSWQRVRPRPSGLDDGRTMVTMAPGRVGAQWLAVQAAALAVRDVVGPARYRLVRYEDLTADPAAVLRSVADFAGLAGVPLPAFDGRTVALGPTHSVTGNPSRFVTGPVAVEADEEWRRGLGLGDRLRVTARAWPAMAALGYRP
jgi:hypothetical protein